MKHILPPLPYAYTALAPSIDEETMRIHHGKHHQAYVDKLNAALEQAPNVADTPVDALLTNLATLPVDDATRLAIRNHGGGHWNHSFFWTNMGPEKQIDAQLREEVQRTFGSLQEFKDAFTNTATTHFGSGWAWLVRTGEGALELYSLPNQDSPLTLGHTPVVALDLWEHAYYLKYQNRRADYIAAWWNVLRVLE